MDQTPSSNKPSERSPDIEGVTRIFAALSEFMTVLKGQFQVIVTEHAGSITWQGIDNVHLVANWREGHDDFSSQPNGSRSAHEQMREQLRPRTRLLRSGICPDCVRDIAAMQKGVAKLRQMNPPREFW